MAERSSRLAAHAFAIILLSSQLCTHATSLDSFISLQTDENKSSDSLIGCLYDETLCNSNQICINDELFGRCVDEAESDGLEPEFSPEEALAISASLPELEKDWSDQFTQCLIRSYTMAYKMGVEPARLSKICQADLPDEDEDEEQDEQAEFIDENQTPSDTDVDTYTDETRHLKRQFLDSYGLASDLRLDEKRDFSPDDYDTDEPEEEEEPFHKEKRESDDDEDSDTEDSEPEFDNSIQFPNSEMEFEAELDPTQDDGKMELESKFEYNFDSSEPIFTNKSKIDEVVNQTSEYFKIPLDYSISPDGRAISLSFDKDVEVDLPESISKRFIQEMRRVGLNLDDGETSPSVEKLDTINLRRDKPFESQSEAEEAVRDLSEELRTPLEFRLSPNGRDLTLKYDKKQVRDSSDVFEKRLKRLGRSTATASAPRMMSKTLPLRTIIIAASVGGFIFCALAAYSVHRVVRSVRERKSNGKRLDLSKEDDEKALNHSEDTADILAPLTEATKSAKSLLSGATGYFTSLASTSKKSETNGHSIDKKVVKKQGSNSSTTSNASQRTSSTSSWSGEPVKMDIDITTGHLILSYLEQHLRDRSRLDADWDAICKYEPDDAVLCEAATKDCNNQKNRPTVPLPYEQSRVKLRGNGMDYINANLLFDHDPRHPAYIATITPMLATISDFWQMVWEQASVVIVTLDRPDHLLKLDKAKAGGASKPVQFWPDEGAQAFGQFEVHLVSEHISCPEYLVRSFYLKNRETNETRTVTQFHFLVWPVGRPLEIVNAMLEFRRKVNKSFRGKGCPTIVHCPDGCGATGTYLLLDLVLNRIQAGIKELNIAASLEHLRDQRPGMIQTKEQFEFVLTAIAEEVNALLKSINS